MWSRVSLAWSRLMLRWARRRRLHLPSWSRRTVLNVAGSVVSVLVAAAAVVVALLADKGHRPVASSTGTSAAPLASSSTSADVLTSAAPTLTDSVAVSSSSSTTVTDTTSATGSASGAPLSDTIARQAVVAYLNAVNARNRVQAGDLICQSLLPSWLQNVDGANSDFNFTITRAQFTGSQPLGGGSLDLHYTLEFNDNTTNDVDFTVIEESGPKICGERRA